MTVDDEPLELTTEQILIIKQAAGRLAAEFDGTFNLETIERYIADSQLRLSGSARFATWMPLLVERFTRDRLRALRRLEVGDVGVPSVLFLCVHNAGRSQIAAGWTRHLAGDRVEVFSGGSEPSSETNRSAIAAMAEVGIDISGEYPRPWTDEIARAADVIVSMGCGDACPVFPGKRYEDWIVPDPAGLEVDEVRPIRDDLRQRVEQLLTELGVAPMVDGAVQGG